MVAIQIHATSVALVLPLQVVDSWDAIVQQDLLELIVNAHHQQQKYLQDLHAIQAHAGITLFAIVTLQVNL